MGRDEARNLGERLAELAGAVRAQAEASEAAHRVHEARDDRLERKIDRLLEADTELAQRVARVETAIQDGTRIAAAFSERQVKAGRERDVRLGHVEATNEHQKGQRQSMMQGLGWSITIFGILAASVISIVAQVLG